MENVNEKYFILKRVNPFEEKCEVLDNKFFDNWFEAFHYYQYKKNVHEELYIRITKEGKVKLEEPIVDTIVGFDKQKIS